MIYRRSSNSLVSNKYRSSSCAPDKKYSVTTMNEIVEKRKENILSKNLIKSVNKIEKKEDFYSKNKKWKDEL